MSSPCLSFSEEIKKNTPHLRKLKSPDTLIIAVTMMLIITLSVMVRHDHVGHHVARHHIACHHLVITVSVTSVLFLFVRPLEFLL